jgi:hypothetical protein
MARSCADGRVLIHDRVYDAGHGWPGEDSLKTVQLDAADVAVPERVQGGGPVRFG